MKEEKTLVTQSCVRLDGRDLKFKIWGLEIKFMENYFFLENYGTSEGAVSHNFFLPSTSPQYSSPRKVWS